MKLIRISPFLPLPFLAALYLGHLRDFALLYCLIFLHETAHFTAALILHLKPKSIHLLPWGCMLSLSSVPKGKRCAIVFAAGPFFNLTLFALGIFQRENLLLTLFNLLPVMPLDGGMIVSLLFPRAARAVSYCAIAALFFSSIYLKMPPVLPVLLLLLTLFERRRSAEKEITLKIRKFLLK